MLLLFFDEDCLLRDAVVTKDVIYEELFWDTGYVEFDALMQECFEMSWFQVYTFC